MVEVEVGAKSWRLAESGVKMARSSLSVVEVLIMEERAARTVGLVKSRDEGLPLLAKSLRMTVMILMVSGVERKLSLVS